MIFGDGMDGVINTGHVERGKETAPRLLSRFFERYSLFCSWVVCLSR